MIVPFPVPSKLVHVRKRYSGYDCERNAQLLFASVWSFASSIVDRRSFYQREFIYIESGSSTSRLFGVSMIITETRLFALDMMDDIACGERDWAMRSRSGDGGVVPAAVDQIRGLPAILGIVVLLE